MRTRRISCLALMVALAGLSGFAVLTMPSAADAQTRTLSWTETSTVEIPGTLGLLLRAMPGALDTRTSQQTLHLQGGALIQQDGKTATIMDADNRRFITIDHEAGTYMTFSFEESAQAAREMSALMAEAMAEAEEAMAGTQAERDAAMAEMRQLMDEARAALNFRIDARNTGRTQSFGAAGTAVQHVITAELEAAEPPEGVEDAEEGTLVFVMELWQSDALPTPDAFYQDWGARLAADPAMQALAGEIAASAEAVGESSAAALAMWDPRLSAGLGEIAEAVSQIQGTTVRSVVTVALVPEGVELDREELLAWQPGSTGDRLRAEAAGAVRDAAADAARTALRGLTGRLGARRDEAQADQAAEAPRAIRPLLRVTTTKEDIVHGETGEDVLGELQRRMEGYRQITMDDLMREAQTR
jgi:hypothetical protein